MYRIFISRKKSGNIGNIHNNETFVLVEFSGVLCPSAETETELTPDKKLMSNLQKDKNLHERYTELFQSGEWSSIKKWTDDAPKERVDTHMKQNRMVDC